MRHSCLTHRLSPIAYNLYRYIHKTILLFTVVLFSLCLIDATATAGWTRITVDSAGDVGQYTSLAFGMFGIPVISYYDETNGDLKYAYDSNLDGDFTDAGEKRIVDSTGDVGRYTSLALDNSGKPAISYRDTTNTDLKYAHDANGDGDFADAGERITVDSAGNVGWYTSLAFNASGNPAISYYDVGNSALKYARFNGASWVITTVDSAGDVGKVHIPCL